jgi:hypothetical protein
MVDALQQRNDALRQAYTQLYPQIQQQNFAQALGVAGLNEQIAGRHQQAQEFQQQMDAQEAARQQQHEEFLASQAQSADQFAASLRERRREANASASGGVSQAVQKWAADTVQEAWKGVQDPAFDPNRYVHSTDPRRGKFMAADPKNNNGSLYTNDPAKAKPNPKYHPNRWVQAPASQMTEEQRNRQVKQTYRDLVARGIPSAVAMSDLATYFGTQNVYDAFRDPHRGRHFQSFLGSVDPMAVGPGAPSNILAYAGLDLTAAARRRRRQRAADQHLYTSDVYWPNYGGGTYAGPNLPVGATL